MTPGARIAAAVELLTAIDGDTSQPADRLVTQWFRQRRYAGSGDRAAISTLVYTVLRRLRQLDWHIARVGSSPGWRARVFAALVLAEGWPAARVAAACDGTLYSAPHLDAPEMAMVAGLEGCGLDDPMQPPAVRGNIPDWLEAPLRGVLGDRLAEELAALMLEAPVDLRVNTLKGTRDEAIASLAADGIAALPTRFSPIGLRLAGRVALGAAQGYKDGLVEVQDEASQLAALLVEAQPGEAVVDLCAGAGGKTLALAACMQGRGRLVACDMSARRLDLSRPRLGRAGAGWVETQVLDRADGLWGGAEERCFDRVLVDAPCTGTGTWRRSPEMRWRLTPEALARDTARQATILDAAARLVRPGGRLVYVVCSLLSEEGEAQVEAFLDRHKDFSPLPASTVWARVVGAPYPGSDPYPRLLPGRDGTDGFFVGVLERR